MRFSISASISTSWRRRSSCSRSSGVPCSRSGSLGGSSASSRRTCVSSCCWVCCSCSICFLVSSLASPTSVSAEGGSGEVARPAAASPPPARLACAIACAFSGASPERELTRIDLERRVLEHPVEALGVDEANAEQRAVEGDRDAERDLQRREPGRQRESHAGAAAIGSALDPRCPPARRRWRSRAGRRCSLSSSSAAALRVGRCLPRRRRGARRPRPRRRASAGRSRRCGRERRCRGRAARRRRRERPAAACRRAPGRPSSPRRRARGGRSASASAATSSARPATGTRCRRRTRRRSRRSSRAAGRPSA